MALSTPDQSLWLDDGAQVYVHTGAGTETFYGKVAGTARVFDTGGGSVPWKGVCAFEPSVLVPTNAPDSPAASATVQFRLSIEGCSNPTFTASIQELGSWMLSALNPQDVIAFTNTYDGVRYRYLRLAITISGGTGQVALKSFIRSLSDLSEYTLSELVTTHIVLAENIKNATEKFRAWMTGVVGGGDGFGRYPLTDGMGNTVYVECPAQIAANSKSKTPFQYGAIGSRGLPWGTWPSRPASMYFATLADCQAVYPFAVSLHQEMDFLAWQKCLDAGGSIRVEDQWEFKMCNSHPDSWTPLVAVAGHFDADCGYSGFHWEQMGVKTDNTEFVANSNFMTSASWQNATQYAANEILPFVFGGGEAASFDPNIPSASQGRFRQFGQLVTLQPGYYTAQCDFEAELGQSYNLGNNQPAGGSIGFFKDAPGIGQAAVTKSADFGNQVQSVIFTPGRHSITAKFDFQITQPTTMWLTFNGSGYVSYYIKYFGIKRWLPNTSILCTRDGDAFRADSPHHYPVPMGFNKMYYWGPGKINGTHAVRWKSFQNTDGNLVIFKDAIFQDCGTHFRFGDGAYLLSFYNVGGGGAIRAIHCEQGTFNAGENNRFYGGGFGNSDILVDNEGGHEIGFYGASTDYALQMCVNNRGRITWNDVHIEMNVPEAFDKPAFEIKDGGACILMAGMFLGAKGVNTSPCAPISTNNSRDIFEVHGTELYNLTSAPEGVHKGAVMSGPGQFRVVSWRNKGNPNLGPRVLSWAAAMDVLGGAGFFNPVTGTPFIAGMGADVTNIDLIGGVYMATADIKPDDEFTDQWTLKRLSASLYTGPNVMDGTHCMKITKHAPFGVGDGGRVMIFIPAKMEHGILGEFNVMFPEAVPGAVAGDTAPLYYRRFWAQITGFDALGRPKINTKQWSFAGEENFDVPLDGSGAGQWLRRSISTLYLGTGSTDPTKSFSAGAPAWATHLAILLDHEALPAMSYYLDGLVANIV